MAKPPSEIRLNEIIMATEGSSAPVDCIDAPEICSRVDLCAARDVWVDVGNAIDSVLKSLTLQDLAERQTQKEATGKGPTETSAGVRPVTGIAEVPPDCRWP